MRITLGVCLGLWLLTPSVRGDETAGLKPGVRGLVVRASGPVKVDGKLDEWTQAFCTPVQYDHKDVLNRAAQFFYLWDEEALYVGLRCLDQKQANPAPLAGSFNGDAVEFYLDTRPGDALRGKDWTEGAIHFYYTAFDKAEIKPRWVMRRGIATSETPIEGVELAATQTADHYDLEFKIPWKNFPTFKPSAGALIAVDAELCHGDGGTRTDRTFAYGSPLSVQQPASLGKVQLVDLYDPDHVPAVGPATFPFWVGTPWVQKERGRVQAVVAIPPGFAEIVGEVVVRIHDVEGKVVKTVPAQLERFGPSGLNFARATASWSIDDFAPGSYFATVKIRTMTGKTLATVAPRMVDEAILSGR
ncbi:MAG: sugar-binding protein [Isosphaeraceae bacterium]